MYYVYILRNDKGRHYIGSCQDVEARLKSHNQNTVTSTKRRGPFKLIYKEGFLTKTAARKRENLFKSYKDPAYLKSTLKIYDPIV